MSEKDCGNHGKRRWRIFRRIIACILVFLLIVLITIFLIWVILRPSRPSFILLDTTVYTFNSSTPNFLTSTFQVTVRSRNPNDRIGILYDRLEVYAEYRDQQITLRTTLPPIYQGHNENNVWSPFIYGDMVPIAPEFFLSVGAEQAAGAVFLTIKIDGRVRWKVGTFVTSRYYIHVRCPAYITFYTGQSNGIIVGENVIKLQMMSKCRVRL